SRFVPMIVGGRAGARLLPRAAILALALGAAPTVSIGLSAKAAAGVGHTPADRAAAPAGVAAAAPGGWVRAWAWRPGSGGLPKGRGLVGRIALWPSTGSRGRDWSGLTVPSADVSPAYATNGCGDETHGAAVPARLAGAFHAYLFTWSPHGFSVAVDGRTLYRD